MDRALMDEEQQQREGRRAQARSLPGVRAILREIYSRHEGRRDHDRRHHGAERAAEPQEHAEPGDAGRAEEALFIKSHLGPAFRAAGIKTRIVLYDHNCDVPEYATAILADPDAARYVDGSGFHLYGGKIEAMSQVHDRYPAKNLYFTEQMVVGSV